MKLNKSVYFRDEKGVPYFLFQVLNFGSGELKFIFNAKNQGTGLVYSSDGSFNSKQDVIVPYSEITYHHDGNFQNKLFPKDNIYKIGDNRLKKPSLDQIDDWEPIIKINIVDYRLCRKKESSDAVFLPESKVFNGEPFECVLCLINLKYTTPNTGEVNDLVLRMNDVAKNIDLLLFIRRSSYNGRLITIPNTNITFLNRSNLITKIERRSE